MSLIRPFHPLQGERDVDLMCQADHFWEFCRWIHKDRYCDYEFMSGDHVQTTACDFPDGKVISHMKGDQSPRFLYIVLL